MQAITKVNCFVRNRYYTKGETYELPDDFPTDHFQVIEEVKPKISSSFICAVCGKELKTKLALSGHRRSHKKEG